MAARISLAKGITDEADIKNLGKKKGFTLIELLVTIAIIGILAGFLIPAVNEAKKKANKAACMNNLKQIGVATQTYENDWKGEILDKKEKVLLVFYIQI